MSAEPDLHQLLMSSCPSYMLQHSDVVIDGAVPLDFKRYPFIPTIIDEHAPTIDIIKGAQMGFSIACIMRALQEAKHGKSLGLRGIGYFFPTEGEVSDFAKARFDPMMTNNMELWGSHVKDTDSAALKRVGDTFLYFRGAGQRGTTAKTKSKSKQKSIPLDRIYLDEADEMDADSLEALYHRLDGSLNPELVRLSTPTLPNYGVDMYYKESDQSVWMWQCFRCNEYTCLELSYPECIAQPANKDPYYLCDKCQKPLERDGDKAQWVARKPDLSSVHRGYWVSQLSSPTQTASDIVLGASAAIAKGKQKEFENQTLARAYAEVDEEITEAQLLALVDPDRTRPLKHEGPCAMGVDPGKPHWYEVRERITDTDSNVVAMGKATSYEELGRIVKAFNVESGVMDQGYDPSAVIKFCDDHPGWFGCLYVGGKSTDHDWDFRERVVRAGRTLALDTARNDIIHKRVSYHQRDEFFNEHFIPQMRNLMRATVEKNNGTEVGEWVVTGGTKNDHLRHADAYCVMALENVDLTRSVRRVQRDTREYSKPRKVRSAMTM